MVQAVIFDADGVLVDASELHFQALNRALAMKGWIISYKEHREIYDGMPTVKKLEALTSLRGFPQKWHEEVLQLKQVVIKEVIRDFLAPKPEQIELFELIRFEGLGIAVSSNMYQDTLDFLMETLGLAPYIDVAIGHDRVGLERVKPHPDLYLHAAIALGSDIGLCAVVVDNSTSYEAARRSDPLDIVSVQKVSDVSPELLPRILRFGNERLSA